MPLRRILLKGMLWSLGFAAVAGVLTVLTRGGDWAWRVVGTGFMTAAACGLMLAMVKLVDLEKTRLSGLIGMAAVVIEFLIGLMLIWDLPGLLWGRWEEELALTMVFLALGAVAVAGL